MIEGVSEKDLQMKIIYLDVVLRHVIFLMCFKFKQKVEISNAKKMSRHLEREKVKIKFKDDFILHIRHDSDFQCCLETK